MQLETEFNPSRIRKCRQDPSHANQPISYICLSPTCKGTARLICGRCLRGDQHRKHQIALINRFVQPFSRLCLNSYQTGAREKYQSLNRSVLSIQKSFNRAEGAVKGYFDDLRKIMIEPIKTICSTYTSDMAESAIRILESDFNDNQEVDSVSEKILFLLSVDPAMFESAMTSFQDIQTQCVKIFNDYNERIGRILEGMKEKLTEIKLHEIGGGDRRRNVVLPRKIERIEDETKNIQQPKTKTNRIESDTAPKVQDEILRRVLTRNNGKIARRLQHPVYHPKDEQKPFGVKTEQSSSGEDEQQAESQKIFCEEEGQEYKPDGSQQNQKAQGELRTQTRLQEQKAAETSSQAGIYSDSPQQDIPFIIRSEQDLRWRQSVNYHKVTTLVVENISESPNFIEKILPQFTSLKVVRIYDPFICTGTNLTKFFDCLPRTTQRICLSCHNEFSQECITTLHKRRMGQIRQLEYFFQVGRDLQRVDENLYFRQQEKNIRIQPLRLRTTNSIFEYFPKIRNIWLPIKNYSRVKKHIPFNQFQDLILGQLQHKIEKLIPPHEKLLADLKVAVNLRCLTLLNVQIRDVEFVKLIHQNPQLHTLYLEYCHDVTENGLAQAVKGSKVVNFCIKQCPQIHGSFLEELANTRIFIMDHANRDVRYDVFRSFSKLNSLQYLNLFGNIHFNDGILASMRPCGHSLRSLNIGYTSITKYFAQSMKYFTNLETLCLDDSRVPMRSVLEALGETRGIEKLSVCGFNGGNERAELTIVQLNEIGNILHNLTHLCIKYCYKLKGIPELNNFKNLKIVEIDARGDQQLIECFQSAGVIVLQDQE